MDYYILFLVFSQWIVCESLWPHRLQHTRLFCLEFCSNSCPLSWWCYLNISSSAAAFSFYLQSFPASGSFPMSQCFTSGGQNIGASASVSVLIMNIQGLFLLGLAWNPSFPRDSPESSPVPQFESIYSLVLDLLYGPTFTFVHDC